MKHYSSFSDIIGALGDPPALAKATGVPLTAVKMWKSRNTIPARRFAAVVSAAAESKIEGITFEVLHALAAAPSRSRPEAQS